MAFTSTNTATWDTAVLMPEVTTTLETRRTGVLVMRIGMKVYWFHATDVALPCEGYIIFTVRRYALHGLCDRNLSVRLSVWHTRALCPHGSTYDHDSITIWQG